MQEPGVEDVAQRIARLEERDQRLTAALELLAQRAAAPAKPGRDWDAYAAVIATFIGLLALAISGYTAYVQRKQLRAQMWPHLRIEYSRENPSFYVLNQGTGPAQVTAVRVTAGGVPVRTWARAAQLAGFTADEGVVLSSIEDAVLSPGVHFTMVRPSDSDASRARFTGLLPGGSHAIAITICYCSVLDECWTAVSGGAKLGVGASGACPIAAADRFSD